MSVAMDCLEKPVAFGRLRNMYFAVRHGTSLANEKGIIVSDPENGIGGYGLSQIGRDEVRRSAENLKRAGIFSSRLAIVASDFDRARQTAEIFASVFEADDLSFDTRLRERDFGTWERTSTSNYKHVWDEDVRDPSHTWYGVQSVASVVEELVSLIRDLEEKHSGTDIILVSHGDRLQILQTLFDNVPPAQHRSLAHLKTAEVRPLN